MELSNHRCSLDPEKLGVVITDDDQSIASPSPCKCTIDSKTKATGGWRAARLILSMELCERLATLGVGLNLVTYLHDHMHLPIPRSANIVTNFFGTSYLTCLLGGFIADTYLGRYGTIAAGSCIQLLGIILMALSSSLASLKPAPCEASQSSTTCKPASSQQLTILYVALYMIAFGTGGIKSSVSGLGADQFEERDAKERRQMQSYFNWFGFGISTGSVLAVTVLVYVQDNQGRGVGYGACAGCMLVALALFLGGTKFYRSKPPTGSALTQIAHVLVAAWRNRHLPLPLDPSHLYHGGGGGTAAAWDHGPGGGGGGGPPPWDHGRAGAAAAAAAPPPPWDHGRGGGATAAPLPPWDHGRGGDGATPPPWDHGGGGGAAAPPPPPPWDHGRGGGAAPPPPPPWDHGRGGGAAPPPPPPDHGRGGDGPWDHDKSLYPPHATKISEGYPPNATKTSNGFCINRSTKPIHHTNQCLFLDRAALIPQSPSSIFEALQSPWRICSVEQVEEVKMFFQLFPILATTIMFWTANSQMLTFSIEQGTTLNRNLGKNFQLPPASLSVFVQISILLTIPFYDRVLVPLVRKWRDNEHGITSLQRIGIGLIFSTLSMVVAALVERKRLQLSHKVKTTNNASFVLPMSVFYLAPQYALVGIGEAFAYIGQLDFFFRESPHGMRSLSTGLCLSTISFGLFLSSAMVSGINKWTKHGSNPGWLTNNLNIGRLDDFYWLLALCSFLSFLAYLLCSHCYNYNHTWNMNTSHQEESICDDKVIQVENFGD